MWPIFPQLIPDRSAGELDGVGIVMLSVTPTIQYDQYMWFTSGRGNGGGSIGRLLITQYLVHLYNIYMKDRNIAAKKFH